MSYKRHKISRRKSERTFTRGAQRVNPKNMLNTAPMRGGIRL